MALKFRIGNIIDTKFQITAVVNSANPDPSIIGDGVENVIYNASGREELLKERKTIGEICPGQAFLSSSCNMHNINGAKYIIHTVATPWCKGLNSEIQVLRSCYIEALKLIKGKNIKSAAFPLLGTGAYGYPLEQAFNIAVEVINQWLSRNVNNCDIWIVTNNPEANAIAIKYQNSNPEVFLTNNYVELDEGRYIHNNYDTSLESYEYSEHEQIKELRKAFIKSQKDINLESKEFLRLNSTGLDIASTLQLLMDKYNITSSDFFEANILNSSYYGKIVNRKNKTVDKNTILAMGFVMRLSQEDFNKLLASGGYALNRSSKTELLALYCIQNQIYNLREVSNIYAECNVDSFLKIK